MNKVFSVIAEMVGRIRPVSFIRATFNAFATTPTVDESHVNYTLSKALFYASVITDPETGNKYGAQYVLGAGFAKPIVNSAAAFAVGKLPEYKLVEGDQKAVDDLNDWIEKKKAEIFMVARNSMRDGDSYIRLYPDLKKCTIIAPQRVTVVTDPVTGELLGYDIKASVKKDNGNSDIYVEELRTVSPFRQVKKYVDGKIDSPTVITEFTETGTDDEERPLPIVHFTNEKEPDQIYGNSEYQNVYFYMENYHAVIENAIKNNIYNSNSVPFLTGIKNLKSFKEANGELQNDGTYKIQWTPEKILLGEEGFDAKVVNATQNAGDADKLLNLLFWSIAQTSETPEFIFGTAVQSSKASVSEQMPIAVMKGQRKQAQFTQSFIELGELYIYYWGQLKNKSPEVELELSWFPILDDDLKLNLEIVTALSEQGVITDNTKLLMLNMNRYVTDFDEEIELARAELAEKNALANQNMLEAQAGAEEELLGDEVDEEPLTPEEAELANAPAV